MIIADKLTKTIPSAEIPPNALRDVSFAIGASSIFGLLGPAEAGKSTLLRLLALRERPDAGSVDVDGVDTGALGERELRVVRAQFSLVDDYRLRAERTVAGNVAAPLERLGVDGPRRRGKVADLLDLVGLGRAGAQHTGELNEGQRRRVAIARGLATAPSVLLLDDPTAGLTADEAAGVLAAIDRARAELDITVVLATRDADVVRKVCDAVAYIADGRLLESGVLLNLLADQDSYTAHALLPTVQSAPAVERQYDRVADVVLVGHATIDSVIPAAVDRNGVEIVTLDGGTTRLAETPVARYRIGLRGSAADDALTWIGDHGGVVATRSTGTRVGAVSDLIAA